MMFETDHSINIVKLATGEERNTVYHWHMFPVDELSCQPPEPKYAFEDSPGTDGDLDATEAVADRVLYNNRTGEWEFYIVHRPAVVPNIDETVSWAQMQSDISNFLQGQKVQVTLADDPDYYYIGRLHISAFDPNKNYQHIKIEYNLEPYKYEYTEFDSGLVTTPQVMSGDSFQINIPVPVECDGSDMPATPVIESLSTKKNYKPKEQLTRGLALLMIYNAVPKINSARSMNISTEILIGKSDFLDVDPEADYYNAVLWAEGRDWVSGYTEYIFAPNNGITRAQFYTVLWRVMGMPNGSGNTAFTDVKNNSYYFKAAQWASAIGLAVGDGNGHFMPDTVISRQQAIFVLWKLCGSPSSTSSVITDVENGELLKPWYYDAVKKLKTESIIEADTGNLFHPGNNISRIKFVEWMWKLAGSPAYETDLSQYTDIGSLTTSQINALKWALNPNNRYMSGTSSTTISPSRPILRKEAYAIFFNYGNLVALSGVGDLYYVDPDGQDNPANGYETPSDVSVDAYYYYAVIWAIKNETTTLDKGYKFNPEQYMTRAMAAQMLFKFWCRANSTYPTYTTAGSAYDDVVCYVLNYATAVYWGYNQSILTDSFISNGIFHIALENAYGTFVADVPYGTHEVPELIIAPGENTFVPTRGTGQYRVTFRRGSL